MLCTVCHNVRRVSLPLTPSEPSPTNSLQKGRKKNSGLTSDALTLKYLGGQTIVISPSFGRSGTWKHADRGRSYCISEPRRRQLYLEAEGPRTLACRSCVRWRRVGKYSGLSWTLIHNLLNTDQQPTPNPICLRSDKLLRLFSRRIPPQRSPSRPSLILYFRSGRKCLRFH